MTADGKRIPASTETPLQENGSHRQPLHGKPVRESQKGNRLKLDSNISKI
jgi:hypothetical protein